MSFDFEWTENIYHTHIWIWIGIDNGKWLISWTDLKSAVFIFLFPYSKPIYEISTNVLTFWMYKMLGTQNHNNQLQNSNCMQPKTSNLWHRKELWIRSISCSFHNTVQQFSSWIFWCGIRTCLANVLVAGSFSLFYVDINFGSKSRFFSYSLFDSGITLSISLQSASKLLAES